MNSCDFQGKLLNDPNTRRDKNAKGEIIVSTYFSLSVRRAGATGRIKYDAVPMKATGEMAMVCEKFLKKGSNIAVTCKYRHNAYRKNGIWYEHGIFHIFEMFFMDEKPDMPEEVTVDENQLDEMEYNDIDFSAME